MCVVKDVVTDTSKHRAPNRTLTATPHHEQLHLLLLADVNDVVAYIVSVLMYKLVFNLQINRKAAGFDAQHFETHRTID